MYKIYNCSFVNPVCVRTVTNALGLEKFAEKVKARKEKGAFVAYGYGNESGQGSWNLVPSGDMYSMIEVGPDGFTHHVRATAASEAGICECYYVYRMLHDNPVYFTRYDSEKRASHEVFPINPHQSLEDPVIRDQARAAYWDNEEDDSND